MRGALNNKRIVLGGPHDSGVNSVALPTFSGGGGKPSFPSTSAGDYRELTRVPLRGEECCGKIIIWRLRIPNNCMIYTVTTMLS